MADISSTRGPLAVRESEADRQLFGIGFYEIDCSKASPAETREWLPGIIRDRTTELPGFFTIRLPCNQTPQCEAIAASGFYLADSQVKLHLKSANFRQMESQIPFPTRMLIAGPEQVDEVAEMAARIFKEDRLHLDPNLPGEKVDERYRNWIRRALHDGSKIYCHENTETGRLVSFVQVRSVTPTSSVLLLGGLHESLHGSRIGASLICICVGEFLRVGNEELTTYVSLGNLGLVRTYLKFGFVPADVTNCFHLYRDPRKRHCEPNAADVM